MLVFQLPFTKCKLSLVSFEMSFIRPARSASVTSEPSPRQNSRSRRRAGDSSDHRSPSELLKQIGLAGPVVVKILKARGWEICEPKGLEEHKRYYLPGGKAQGDSAKHGEDYLVGEGELYEYVLEKGGANYITQNSIQASVSSMSSKRSSKSVPRNVGSTEKCNADKAKTTRRLDLRRDTEFVEESDESCSSSSHQHKKRRKKQTTSELAQVFMRQMAEKSAEVVVVDGTDSTASEDHNKSGGPAPVESKVRPTRPTEVEQYESSLKLGTSRAQLLKDIDLNLLRSVAEIAYRQSALQSSDKGNAHELERFAQRIQVAMNCLSFTVAEIVDNADNLSDPDEGVDIPSFVCTGRGRLTIMQDIERYLLLVGQTLRQLQYSERNNSSPSTSPGRSKVELRPLQRHIDKTAGELLGLAKRICETIESKPPSDQPMEASSRNRRRRSDPFAKPSELLQRIGIRGKEVVRIIKTRGWEVCDPKALQEHKLYYVPGGRAKGEQGVQGVDYFVGEGELFSYILGHGGIHFLLPGEVSTETKEDSDSDFELLDDPPPQRLQIQQIVDVNSKVSTGILTTEESSNVAAPQEPKRKRRKKLMTGRKVKATKSQERQPSKKSANANSTITQSTDCVKEEKIPFVAADGCGQLVEFGAYEAALTAQGWQAQLLRDIDLHLLRSVAAIARRQLVLGITSGDLKTGSSRESATHEGILEEFKVLSSGIKASQNDLSSMIVAIIQQAESAQSQESSACIPRIGIVGFVSTGPGNLILLRDIERHLLLTVAAVRQYLRAKNVSIYSGGDASTSKPPALRALQLNIEKMNAELTELLTIISEHGHSSVNSSSTPMTLEADVDTDSEQWMV
ncbi:hypothetical protein P3T76_011731 [Phytophthora citrophthora]|uniref:Uncharacterized protein n=1 Tax=Phytophthora citrophthora TaxID=4793 RepID=A0AAD9G8Q7_9STRA|nr:hypothetical protein P3T76_011731 [Phytophthora citrophthora]